MESATGLVPKSGNDLSRNWRARSMPVLPKTGSLKYPSKLADDSSVRSESSENVYARILFFSVTFVTLIRSVAGRSSMPISPLLLQETEKRKIATKKQAALHLPQTAVVLNFAVIKGLKSSLHLIIKHVVCLNKIVFALVTQEFLSRSGKEILQFRIDFPGTLDEGVGELNSHFTDIDIRRVFQKFHVIRRNPLQHQLLAEVLI